MPGDGVLPLVVLPNTCSLQRFIVAKLNAHRVHFKIAHSASGVGGLHLALAAGLGVTCLNTSSVPESAVAFTGIPRLPPLPEVEFRLAPPRTGETAVISEVTDMLAEQFS
jgi:DNA-binding transcriptional LysR family regulator